MKPHIREQFTNEMFADLLERWGAESKGWQLSGGSMNLLYEVTINGCDRVMRVTDRSRRTPEAIRAELRWINHLRSCDISVCAPVCSSRGKWLEECGAEQCSFYAAVFERAKGVRVRRADLDRTHMMTLGRLLASLHNASTDYPRTDRMMWDYNFPGLLRLISDDSEIVEALTECEQAIRQLPYTREGFGLVHNDLHMHNYLVDDETIWLFDFDSCVYNWYVGDLACTWYFALSWIAGMDTEIWHKMRLPTLKSLLDGYAPHRELDPIWISQLPLFFRFRALSLYAFLSHRAGPQPDEDTRIRLANARHYAMSDMSPIVTAVM